VFATRVPVFQGSVRSHLTSLSRLRRALRLFVLLEFKTANMAAADHALIVDYVAADDLGHHGQIEVTDFRVALGEAVKHTVSGLDRRQFLF
jgi:hypothetical protein